MPSSAAVTPRALLGHLGTRAGRWGRTATTLLRSGIVPVRPDTGLAILPSLIRHGTTLVGLYAGAAAAVGDRPSLMDDDRTVTFAELDRRTQRLAAGLSAHHDIGSGSVIGLLARNHIAFVEALLACGRLGADVVLLNSGMSAAQAAVVAEQQQLRLLIVDPDLADVLADVSPDIPRLACGAAAEDMPGRGPMGTDDLVDAGGPPPGRTREHGRVIVMTSGTTGAPKGARRPASAGPDALASILSRIPLRADETTYIAPPLFHTWGLANLQLAAALRCTVVLRRRFDPATAMDLVAEHRCTVMAVVPVMLQRILEHEQDHTPAAATPDLRVVAASGSALPGDLATRWMQAHASTLYNLYGSTEVSWATIATPAELWLDPRTAGRPPHGTRLAVLDDEGRPLPPGEVGRIFVGNDLQFEGYVGQSAGRDVVEGMLPTGDVGHIDGQGLLFVVGRDDDMIVSGGENVHPSEVEDLLAARPDVVEVAVIGVDDDDFGQRLAAFVVLRDPTGDGSPDGGAGDDDRVSELKDHVARHLARQSVPRDVVIVEELPRNPTGKVVARELRSLLG